MKNLTKGEIQVLKLLVKGEYNKNIAKSLNISVHTIKVYVSSIINKLNAKNRIEVAYIAGKNKTLD
jgi:DNA-binding NarL/FixJ family response regulator